MSCLRAFLRATQPEAADTLALHEDSPTRRRFLARLQGEVAKRGTIDVLRHGPHHLHLFYGTPSPGNEPARERFEHNRFTVTRQLRYSRDETQRALDIGLFVNGLPVFTFEIKNRLTKQTVDDAVQQYRKDRNWREKLFEFGRCVAHFAVDDREVRFCTRLQGKSSWFLPFNRGWNDGAGNPPNPDGIKTDYLWRAVLSRDSLTDILENYAQVVKTRDEKTGRKKRDQVWPRYHQLDVVRRLLADAGTHGAARRFAILIDEAHSSQGGRTSGAMTQALAEAGQADEVENVRGPDQPPHGVPQAAPQRQLLRLHRHPQEQDAGDLRRPGAATPGFRQAATLCRPPGRLRPRPGGPDACRQRDHRGRLTESSRRRLYSRRAARTGRRPAPYRRQRDCRWHRKPRALEMRTGMPLISSKSDPCPCQSRRVSDHRG